MNRISFQVQLNNGNTDPNEIPVQGDPGNIGTSSPFPTRIIYFLKDIDENGTEVEVTQELGREAVTTSRKLNSVEFDELGLPSGFGENGRSISIGAIVEAETENAIGPGPSLVFTPIFS